MANPSIKVLLADDSITMHRAVALSLKKEPVELICCDNGQDGFRLAIEHAPAIVLADLDMPGMTGIELCSRIRAEAKLAHTKVVLLCGSFDQVDEGHLESVQADGRLWKPFESHVLITLIQKLLQESASSHSTPDSQATLPGTSMRPPERTIEKTIAPPPPPPKRPVAAALPPTRPESLRVPEKPRDLAMDMTRETFYGLNSEPQVTSEPTAAMSHDEPERSISLSDEPTRQNVFESPQDEAENLWAADFKSDIEETLADVSTPPPKSFAQPPSEHDMGNFRPSATPPRNNARPPTSSLRETLSGVSGTPTIQSGRPTLSTPPNNPASFLPETPATTGLNADEVRSIIREEIDHAFRGWLQDQLQEKLSRVMAEIDRE